MNSDEHKMRLHRAFIAIILLCIAPVCSRANETITVVSWGGVYEAAQRRAIYDPFTRATGVKVKAVTYSGGVAAQWSTMISGVFSAPDWQVIVLTKSACAIVDESYYYDKVGGTYEVCTEWRNSALEYIADIDPDIVVVGSAVRYEFSKSQWIDGSSRIMDRLSKTVDHVIVIPGTPRLSFDGPSCIEDPLRFSFRLIGGGRECEEAESGSLRIEVTSYLADVAEKFSNIVLLDMSDLICPDGKCAAQSANGMEPAGLLFRMRQ